MTTKTLYKWCNNPALYEYLSVPRTRINSWLDAYYCMLFSKKVRYRVRLFSAYAHCTRIFTSSSCH